MLIINRFGDKENPVLKGDFPGHPYRGNQYDGGGGYGSQFVGTPSPFQVAAGNKVKAMGEDLRTKITQAQKDGEEVGYARVVAMKIREAAVPLKGAYDDPPARLKESKQIIASAKREYKKLPEGNMKQQIGTALTEIDAIMAKL